ncbi:MAG TPA: hypothetical protein VE553_03810, partial [Candidatus Binatia bacterium]|nr:hypothetical protein [Candidatus Binatia bacterium]
MSFVIVTQVAAAEDPPATTFSVERWFGAADFAEGQGEDVVVGQPGITIAASATSATYTSPEFDAPIPFNALVPRWQADLPAHDALEEPLQFEFRTATDQDSSWSEWLPLHESADNSGTED